MAEEKKLLEIENLRKYFPINGVKGPGVQAVSAWLLLNTARHPSTIGVAVNVGCWSHRRGHLIVNSDLTVTCDTHSTWKFNA